jgi:hypothetical protein
MTLHDTVAEGAPKAALLRQLLTASVAESTAKLSETQKLQLPSVRVRTGPRIPSLLLLLLLKRAPVCPYGWRNHKRKY